MILPDNVTASGALLTDGNTCYYTPNTTATLATADGYIFKAHDQATNHTLAADVDLSGVKR